MTNIASTKSQTDSIQTLRLGRLDVAITTYSRRTLARVTELRYGGTSIEAIKASLVRDGIETEQADVYIKCAFATESEHRIGRNMQLADKPARTFGCWLKHKLRITGGAK